MGVECKFQQYFCKFLYMYKMITATMTHKMVFDLLKIHTVVFMHYKYPIILFVCILSQTTQFTFFMNLYYDNKLLFFKEMEQVQQQGKIHLENLHDKQVIIIMILLTIHSITKVYISHHIANLLTAINFTCPDFHLITFPHFITKVSYQHRRQLFKSEQVNSRQKWINCI